MPFQEPLDRVLTVVDIGISDGYTTTLRTIKVSISS